MRHATSDQAHLSLDGVVTGFSKDEPVVHTSTDPLLLCWAAGEVVYSHNRLSQKLKSCGPSQSISAQNKGRAWPTRFGGEARWCSDHDPPKDNNIRPGSITPGLITVHQGMMPRCMLMSPSCTQYIQWRDAWIAERWPRRLSQEENDSQREPRFDFEADT